MACSNGTPPAGHTPAAPLTARAPSGPTSWPFEFTWDGAAGDTVVRLRVLDDVERHVFALDTRGPRIAAPDQLKPLLTPGKTYLWRVSRLDENGEEAGTSAMMPFTLRK